MDKLYKKCKKRLEEYEAIHSNLPSLNLQEVIKLLNVCKVCEITGNGDFKLRDCLICPFNMKKGFENYECRPYTVLLTDINALDHYNNLKEAFDQNNP